MKYVRKYWTGLCTWVIVTWSVMWYTRFDWQITAVTASLIVLFFVLYYSIKTIAHRKNDNAD